MVDAHHYCFQLSFGKGRLKSDKSPKPTGVLKELMHTFIQSLPLNMGSYLVVADNYYGSIDVARLVREHGHHFLGTLRQNRPTALLQDCLHQVLAKSNSKQNVLISDGESKEVEEKRDKKQKIPNPTSAKKTEEEILIPLFTQSLPMEPLRSTPPVLTGMLVCKL